jgi:hypothetical protein
MLLTHTSSCYLYKTEVRAFVRQEQHAYIDTGTRQQCRTKRKNPNNPPYAEPFVERCLGISCADAQSSAEVALAQLLALSGSNDRRSWFFDGDGLLICHLNAVLARPIFGYTTMSIQIHAPCLFRALLRAAVLCRFSGAYCVCCASSTALEADLERGRRP